MALLSKLRNIARITSIMGARAPRVITQAEAVELRDGLEQFDLSESTRVEIVRLLLIGIDPRDA